MKSVVLVSGGAGFIGSHVADQLIERGYNVIILDDLSGGFLDNVNPKAKFYKGSILNTVLIEKIFNSHPIKYVFHLAAYAAEGLSHFIKRFNYTNNLIGSMNLINASVNHQVKCFVFTSSIAVYGKNQLPMREDLMPLPEDSYGIAKFAVELELKASHEMFGLPYIIFRPHNVYGPKQNIGDRYRNVIGIFMNQIMKEESLTVFGDGKQTRAFSYINDIAPIIARSVEVKKAYNKIFNIGADHPYSINQLICEIGDSMGVKPKIHYLAPRKEVIHAYSDHQKVRGVFNQGKTVSLSEGIRQMAEWCKKAGPRKSKPFENIEILKNLPSSWLK
ncbi:MAG: NAD-dependent epimerase/dehydratase family protein [Elusimicrobia bacterium]|nr:NAD-dependent epimerase/dehydratase family protein [Elusimicrobiota bacterium]